MLAPRLAARASRLALCASLIVLPAALTAQADRWDRQAEAALHRAGPLLADQGFQSTTVARYGMLSTDESERVTIPVSAGRSYAIVGVCDEDCGNLDLVLSRSARQEVTSDRGDGNVPIVKVTTELAGTYGLKVIMTACRLGPCRYGIAVYSRPVSGSPSP
ncbi:MAG: hypothetical protein SGJ01_17090 [Gemmatimonadota bacterium]|nr:hypothetical protein [Gemmatimonadota bacterium]